MLQVAPTEKISLPDLIRTDNKILNKVLIALSALCTEIVKLEKEAITDFYDPLVFYGEGSKNADIKFLKNIAHQRFLFFSRFKLRQQLLV